MRSPMLMASCLASLLGASPLGSSLLGASPLGSSLLGSMAPAAAQPRLVTQPVSLGLPPDEAEKASTGAVEIAPSECRPVFTTGSRPVGPAMAEPEKQTEGRVVVGFACDSRR